MSISKLRKWAKVVKRDIHAVYLASHDPRVPWYAKLLAVLVVAYALSPVDLTPDFISIIGYLDDLVLLPLSLLLVIRLLPPGIMAEHRSIAEKDGRLPQNWVAAAMIIFLWAAGIVFLGWIFLRN
ncbi:MAG: membrane protein [Nitrospirales bacterium]|nr:MAG: membrane protein [Nitrospirales bacterium]